MSANASEHALNALTRVFESPNECDRNFEPANVVDGLFFIGRAIKGLTEAIEQSKPSPPSHGGELDLTDLRDIGMEDT